MSDRDEKADDIRERSASRRDNTDRQERMRSRLEDDTKTPATPASGKCQATVRGGDQCSNDATTGRYCQKHQPNKYGELTWQFKRKQWYLNPELMDEIFEDERGCGSLYDTVQENVGSISQKSFENTAAEFLVEHSDEFIEFAMNKYSTDE